MPQLTHCPLEDQILLECQVMARHALSNGKTLPTTVLSALGAHSSRGSLPDTGPDPELEEASQILLLQSLATAHQQLVEVISPVCVSTLVLFETEKKRCSSFYFLGSIPFLRRMMSVAMILVGWLGTTLSAHVNEDTIKSGLFNAHGIPLLMNELFLLFAAGLGACFAALFQVNRHLQDLTYNTRFETSYWIKFALGLISGIFLSLIVDVPGTEAKPGALYYSKALLAMSGGFSASLVYRILIRLTETIESLFQGSTKELVATRERSLEIQYQQKLAQEKARFASQLMLLRKSLPESASSEYKENLENLLKNTWPSGRDPGSSGNTTFQRRTSPPTSSDTTLFERPADK